MTLTRKDKLQLFGLLDGLQVHLESAIEGCIKEFIADDDPERTAKLMERKSQQGLYVARRTGSEELAARRRLEDQAGETMRTPEQIEALREGMNRIDWWHAIEIGDGLVTPGRESAPRSRDPYLRIPEDLTGKSVLDIGAWDGLYSFEAEKRGARRIVAVDLWPSKDGFDFAHAALQSKVEAQEADVENLSSYFLPGTRFDVVFCFGVLYHLKNGIMPALAEIHQMTEAGGLLIVETALARIDETETRLVEFVEHSRDGDPTNWWYPNRAAMMAMLRATGFVDVEYTGGVGGRGTFHARKP